MQDLKKVHVISHTHWDREWYLPKEKFRFMLVKVLDTLLNLLDENKEYYAFMFDGQTIALEDYLDIRPENEQRLKKYISEERILIGPWYVLPDEILISGECHIRNYLLGNEMCSKFGGNMDLGYLPDSFGHPSQMPQILKGLGMNELIFWRGLGPEIDKTEFRWIGSDNSEILAVNMPFSYGIGACMPEDREHFIRRLKSQINNLSKLTDTNHILYMNGVDHVAPQKFIPQYIEEYKNSIEGCELKHSTLPEYIKDVRKSWDDLKKYKGELRSPQRAYLLGGTVSTRMYIKKANFEAERIIEKWIEPMSTLAMISGKVYPYGEIRKLWRDLMSNLPHDSICGCSIDEVHTEMMGRYQNIMQLAESILDDNLDYIADSIQANEKHDGAVVVFNSLGHSRTDVVSASIDVNEQLFRKVYYDTGILTDYEYDKDKKLPDSIKIYNSSGVAVECKLDKCEKVSKLKLSLDTQPEMFEVQRLEVSFIAKNVPALGYDVYYYDLVYDEKDDEQPNTAECIIENEYFKIVPEGDGTITIYDKETDKYYEKCNCFVDSGDAGDEYTYSPPLNDKLVNVDRESLVIECMETSSVRQSIKISGIMSIPCRINEDRKDRSDKTVVCKVSSIITIYPGIRRIDIKTDFDNKALDHRLRVMFPTAINADYASSEGIFTVDSRKIMDNLRVEDYKDWIEMPGNVHPQKSFVDINDDQVGLLVANRGITECEVYKEDGSCVVALTLLRCVEWLSRGDLLYRKGNAGWTIPTPEAQCQGHHVFEYSIVPHKDNWEKSRAFIEAHNFNVPLKAVKKGTYQGSLSSKGSAFEISSSEIVLSAFKRAEKEESIVLRMFNTSGHAVDTDINLNFEIKKVDFINLKEEVVEEVKSIEDNCFTVHFEPHQIISLLIKR